jgi:hypothetical protein
MLWTTREYEVFKTGKDAAGGNRGYLITMGEPEKVEWYGNGRRATRAEVDHSIETGLPTLEAIARQQPDGQKYLDRYIERFQKYLPV